MNSKDYRNIRKAKKILKATMNNKEDSVSDEDAQKAFKHIREALASLREAHNNTKDNRILQLSEDIAKTVRGYGFEKELK